MTHGHVIVDITGCSLEVASLPEAVEPVAFANALQFLSDLVRRAPLSTPRKIVDLDAR